MDGTPNNTRTVILDTSEVDSYADYGGMLYELKKAKILEGKDFQIDNTYDLLMDYDAFNDCKNILEKFRVKAVNL